MSTTPPHAYTVSSRIVSRIVENARPLVGDIDVLVRSVGLEPAQIDDIDARIDIAPYLRLWGVVVAAIGDSSFPLRVAASGNYVYNILRFVCMASQNLGEAFARASRYLAIMTDSVSWPIEMRGEQMVLAIERHAGAEMPEARWADDFALAELVAHMRLYSGREVGPTLVRFNYPEPQDTSALKEYFRAPLEFGVPRAEIHIAQSVLSAPLLKADPATVAFFERYIENLLADGPPSKQFTSDVRRVVANRLRGEAPTIAEVAAELGMSTRTLGRRLRLEGTTYQALLDDTRFALARQHIQTGHLSFAEISALLGFSEPSAFHRAFRRWTGMTPQGYATQT